MRGIDVSRGGIYGSALEQTQSRVLGDIVVDESGRKWVYGRFDQEFLVGDLVRDAVTSDMVTVDASQVYASITSAAAIGTQYLTDSGAFNGKEFAGAIGQIVTGAGLGQSFTIAAMDTDDRVTIEILSNETALVDAGDEGWLTALTTASKYTLALPGAFFQGDEGDADSNYINRGFVQQIIASGDIGKFGYACKKGLCFAKFNRGGNSLIRGEYIIPDASGAVQGAPATLTVDDVMNAVGRCVFTDITGSGNALALIEADCPGVARALALPDDMKEPLTRITVR